MRPRWKNISCPTRKKFFLPRRNWRGIRDFNEKRRAIMAVDIVMPQMGESIFEGTITKWLKKPGDKVERDEPLFEISTDKVDAEIPSPSAGVLKEIKVGEGQTVPIQTIVGVIDAAGAAAAAPSPAPTKTALPASAAAKTPTAGPAPATSKPAAPAPAAALLTGAPASLSSTSGSTGE